MTSGLFLVYIFLMNINIINILQTSYSNYILFFWLIEIDIRPYMLFSSMGCPQFTYWKDQALEINNQPRVVRCALRADLSSAMLEPLAVCVIHDTRKESAYIIFSVQFTLVML